MASSSRRLSPPALIGVVVFIVIAVLIAVFLDAPTSVWLLVALAVVALAVSGVFGTRANRQRS